MSNGTYSVASAGVSFVAGATFGGVFGSTNAAALGIPYQGAFIKGLGSGISGGFVGGAAGHTVVTP